MNISSNKYGSIEAMHEKLQGKNSKASAAQTVSAFQSFRSILQQANDTKEKTQVKFSKHASERLLSRKIDLSKEQLDKLSLGTAKAKAKGIKESLVMVDGMSFIVSCKNNTVITAVGDEDEHIFTNIDGAIIM